MRPASLAARLLGLFVRCVLAARVAELLHLQTAGRRLLVLGRRVVAVLAIGALHRDDFAHGRYSYRGQPLRLASSLPVETKNSSTRHAATQGLRPLLPCFLIVKLEDRAVRPRSS